MISRTFVVGPERVGAERVPSPRMEVSYEGVGNLAASALVGGLTRTELNINTQSSHDMPIILAPATVIDPAATMVVNSIDTRQKRGCEKERQLGREAAIASPSRDCHETALTL
jgi:hypothetical protein